MLFLIMTPDDPCARSVAEEKHVEVALRMIGHRVLLASGDSTSRVLPLEKEEGAYRITFESPFGFNPEDLVAHFKAVFQESKISGNYIIEVEKCDTDDVVYSFEVGEVQAQNLVPCKSRDLPKDCYEIVMTFTDEAVEVAGIMPVDQVEQTGGKEDKWWLWILGMAVIMFSAIVLIRNHLHKGDRKDTITMGSYRFDPRKAILQLDAQRIRLSQKEADLLLLLYQSVNDTVKREDLLKEIWEDDGDYVGRTVDVFISKLRKHLLNDPTVNIVNVRGVGYKLVIG